MEPKTKRAITTKTEIMARNFKADILGGLISRGLKCMLAPSEPVAFCRRCKPIGALGQVPGNLRGVSCREGGKARLRRVLPIESLPMHCPGHLVFRSFGLFGLLVNGRTIQVDHPGLCSVRRCQEAATSTLAMWIVLVAASRVPVTFTFLPMNCFSWSSLSTLYVELLASS